MKLLCTLIAFFFFHSLQAQVLLLPTADRHFELYREQCQKEGYLCTTNFLLDTLQKLPTPQFDLLLEELDYSSKEYCNGLTKRVLNILKTEMISIEQVEILIKLLGQAKSFVASQNLKSLQAIEVQLQEDLALVQKVNLKELPAEFIVVFKKPLPLNLHSKFRSTFLKEKSERIKFTQALLQQENLVSGACGNENIHSSVQDVKWQIDHENTCGFSSQVVNLSRSSANFVKENKNSLLIGSVLAISAVLLMNKYEVEFSF